MCKTCQGRKRIIYPGLNYLKCESTDCEHEIEAKKDYYNSYCWLHCRTVECPDCVILKDVPTH
jgi:hypothetical protein